MSISELIIFDFDNTLFIIDTYVIINKPSGQQLRLSNQQFTHYIPEHGDQFDFSEFDKYITKYAIVENLDKLHKCVQEKSHYARIIVLTSRWNDIPIKKLFQYMSINNNIEIVTLGHPNCVTPSNAKAKWIEEQIQKYKIKKVWIIDDSEQILKHIQYLQLKYPSIYIETKLFIP